MDKSIIDSLKNGLNYIKNKNNNIAIENYIINYKKNRFSLDSNFNLPFNKSKRFNLFYLNNQKTESKPVLFLLLADTKNFTIDLFCINKQTSCQTGKNLEAFVKRKFGKQWTVNTVSAVIRQKPIEKPLIKKTFKPILKNLLWTLLYIDLKLFNPEFRKHILVEYIHNNIEKRDLNSILLAYKAKISA